MNALKNAVHLIGNLGKDVQIVEFESGSKKATCSLATTESYRNSKGEMVKSTQWHNLIAWGKSAEMMVKILEKGTKVAVHGMITYRTYVDKEGRSKNFTEIVVNEFLKVNDTATKKEVVESE